jgi:PhzF family phenazine biosynthesis protein
MRPHRLVTVDVFTARPLLGNPVAVVLDADDVPADDMQRVAAWMNLSETTFVLRPTFAGADYRLRIFTPRGELPFAGHPTVGSAHAVMETGVVPAGTSRLVQECAAGLVPIRVEAGDGPRRLFVRVPRAEARRAAAIDAAAVGRALGASPVADAPPLVIDVGAVWLVVALEREEDVRTLRPDMGAVSELSRRLETVGVTVYAPAAKDGLVVRSFAPVAGVAEDPVCGSGNASVAAHVAATGRLVRIGTEWTASQGREVGRDGAVRVRVADEGRAIEIGGHAVTVVDGTITI